MVRPKYGQGVGFTLVLLRHGRSEWNDRNLFTGWVDSDLSARGIDEAKRSGELMVEAGIRPDVVHTSLLVRAIRTAWIAQDAMQMTWLPVHRSWRLNERHYGALQGLNKKETTEKYGVEQVKLWRRSYDVPPPDIERGSEFDVSGDPRYRDLPPEVLPLAECLKDTLERTLPYWDDVIVPDLRRGTGAARRRARQLPASHREAPRRHQRRRHLRAQHPDREPARVRARRLVRAGLAPVPRPRCGRRRRRRGGRPVGVAATRRSAESR